MQRHVDRVRPRADEHLDAGDPARSWGWARPGPPPAAAWCRSGSGCRAGAAAGRPRPPARTCSGIPVAGPPATTGPPHPGRRPRERRICAWPSRTSEVGAVGGAAGQPGELRITDRPDRHVGVLSALLRRQVRQQLALRPRESAAARRRPRGAARSIGRCARREIPAACPPGCSARHCWKSASRSRGVPACASRSPVRGMSGSLGTPRSGCPAPAILRNIEPTPRPIPRAAIPPWCRPPRNPQPHHGAVYRARDGVVEQPPRPTGLAGRADSSSRAPVRLVGTACTACSITCALPRPISLTDRGSWSSRSPSGRRHHRACGPAAPRRPAGRAHRRSGPGRRRAARPGRAELGQQPEQRRSLDPAKGDPAGPAGALPSPAVAIATARSTAPTARSV